MGTSPSRLWDVARAAASTQYARNLPIEDALIEAWEGAALHLAEHPESVEKACYTAAIRNLGKAYDKSVQAHGYGPRFTMYWEPKARAYQRDVLTPLALVQVMAKLSDADREILIHVSEYPTLRAAAASLGWAESTMRVAARRAAEKARKIWFDFESPPPHSGGRKRLKTHCAKGHEFSHANTQWVRDSKGNLTRRCGTCNRESQRAIRSNARAAAGL